MRSEFPFIRYNLSVTLLKSSGSNGSFCSHHISTSPGQLSSPFSNINVFTWMIRPHVNLPYANVFCQFITLCLIASSSQSHCGLSCLYQVNLSSSPNVLG